MAVFKLEDFSDITDRIREELKVQADDTTSVNRIKRLVNEVYLNEVVPFHRWWWLRKRVDVDTRPAFFLGSAAVVSNSNVVTLTEAPATSRKGWKFMTNAYPEINYVKTHDEGSNTLYLETPYMGKTDTAARFTVWTDDVELPTDAKETFEIWHDFSFEPMKNLGIQDFRRTVKLNPHREGLPAFYTPEDYTVPAQYTAISSLPTVSTRSSTNFLKTIVFTATLGATGSTLLTAGDRIRIKDADHKSYNGDFQVLSITTTNVANDTVTYASQESRKELAIVDSNIDVKILDVENEDKRLKRIKVYPSILKSKVTLHVDYIQDAPALEDDADQPLMPNEDKVVLIYGGLGRAWASIGRNPEESQRNEALFRNKLIAMKNKHDDGVEYPMIIPSRDYLERKRRRI